MGAILFENIKDKELFDKSLNQNIDMLFGKKADKCFRSIFKENINKKINCIQVLNWNKKDADLCGGVIGYTTFTEKGKFDVKLYGHEGFTGDPQKLEVPFSHEVWHILINTVNSIYGTEQSVKLDDKERFQVSAYNGFLACKNSEREFTVGYFTLECLVQILSYATVGKNRDNDKVLDDYFNYNFESDDVYIWDEFLTLGQLFLAAFNLDAQFSFNDHYNNGYGLLMEYYAHSKTKAINNANLFISGSIKNPIEIMLEYDKFMGEGAYVRMQHALDAVYFEYRDNHILKVNKLISIINNIKEFVKMRLYYKLDTSAITRDEYDVLLNNFNELYKVFREELKLYRVNSAKMKYRKLKNRLLKR